MDQVLLFILTILMAFGLAACGGGPQRAAELPHQEAASSAHATPADATLK